MKPAKSKGTFLRSAAANGSILNVLRAASFHCAIRGGHALLLQLKEAGFTLSDQAPELVLGGEGLNNPPLKQQGSPGKSSDPRKLGRFE